MGTRNLLSQFLLLTCEKGFSGFYVCFKKFDVVLARVESDTYPVSAIFFPY